MACDPHQNTKNPAGDPAGGIFISFFDPAIPITGLKYRLAEKVGQISFPSLKLGHQAGERILFQKGQLRG